MDLFRAIYRFFVDAIQGIVIGGALAVFIFAFLFQPHEVSGSSMYPTLKDKEYVITSLVDKHLDRIKRGDVIVFNPPIETDKHFIKRVIGMSGETIRLTDGDVYVNDTKLDERAYIASYLRTNGGSFLGEGKSVTVPDDSFFVMGDNRLFSSDSREWGFLKKSEVIGHSIVRIWPPMTFIILRNPFSN